MIVGMSFSILNIHYLEGKECKDLGFDGMYSDSNHCYNKIYYKDGTYSLQLKGRADPSFIYVCARFFFLYFGFWGYLLE